MCIRDRYISGQTTSLSQKQGRDLNFGPKESNMYNMRPYSNMNNILNQMRDDPSGVVRKWPQQVSASLTKSSATTGLDSANSGQQFTTNSN